VEIVVSRSHTKIQKKPAPQNKWGVWIGVAVLIAIALLVAGYFWSQGGAGVAAPPNIVGLPVEIAVKEAVAKRDAGAFILDVRTPEEWKEFHVPNSTLIPLDELPKRVAEVPRDKEVVVVCRSGNRSQAGRDILLNAGFTKVTSMSRGLNEWRTLGFPTVTGP
jgi:rhodanese-related sulfurtransferase